MRFAIPALLAMIAASSSPQLAAADITIYDQSNGFVTGQEGWDTFATGHYQNDLTDIDPSNEDGDDYPAAVRTEYVSNFQRDSGTFRPYGPVGRGGFFGGLVYHSGFFNQHHGIFKKIENLPPNSRLLVKAWVRVASNLGTYPEYEFNGWNPISVRLGVAAKPPAYEEDRFGAQRLTNIDFGQSVRQGRPAIVTNQAVLLGTINNSHPQIDGLNGYTKDYLYYRKVIENTTGIEVQTDDKGVAYVYIAAESVLETGVYEWLIDDVRVAICKPVKKVYEKTDVFLTGQQGWDTFATGHNLADLTDGEYNVPGSVGSQYVSNFQRTAGTLRPFEPVGRGGFYSYLSYQKYPYYNQHHGIFKKIENLPKNSKLLVKASVRVASGLGTNPVEQAKGFWSPIHARLGVTTKPPTYETINATQKLKNIDFGQSASLGQPARVTSQAVLLGTINHSDPRIDGLNGYTKDYLYYTKAIENTNYLEAQTDENGVLYLYVAGESIFLQKEFEWFWDDIRVEVYKP